MGILTCREFSGIFNINQTQSTVWNEKLLEIKDFFRFTQIIKENTRGLNVLDICFVKTPDFYSNINIVPGISDHDAITVTVNQNARVNRKPPRKVYQFKKADMNQVRDKCKQFCEYYTSQVQSHSASENWNTFKNGLNQVIEENIPTKMIKEKHNLPWITQSIKRIVRRRKRARCKARRTRSIPDWERYKELPN